MTPVVQSPGEGEQFAVGPLSIRSRVSREQSGGAFEYYEIGLGVATVDYHVHRTMDETITVLEGEIEFAIVGKTYLRPEGSTVLIPRGLHHGFRNRGPGRARVLVLFTPATDQAEYFRELARLLEVPSRDAAAIKALQKKYDQELMGDGPW